MRREWRGLWGGTLTLAVLGVFVALRLQVSTDITHFLPDGAAAGDVHIAREIASSELARTMVLLVDGPDTDTAVRASRSFERALHDEPRVEPALAHLDAGPPDGIEDALWTTYQPRRFAFLANDAQHAKALLTQDALDAAATNLRQQLARPLSSMISRVAPSDPLLILPHMFERILAGRADGLRLVDGRFVTEDGRGAVLFLATTASASDGAVQEPLLAGVDAAFARTNAEFDHKLTLSSSGTNRFAVRAETSIRADIQRVSIGSAVGLIALFLLLFSSLRLVLLTLPVLGAGFLAGTSACLLCFGKIHGLTLAFGSALIGVSVDYAVHFHCHQVLAPEREGPQATLRSIWSGLLLGAATTIVGFCALMVSTFPGLRQLAVFASFGFAAALLATRFMLPAMAARHTEPTAITRWLVRLLERLLQPRGRSRVLLWIPVAATALLATIGIPRLQWSDGIGDLHRMDPQLQAEDLAVRARVVRFEQRRLVLALGSDEEAALQCNDQILQVLGGARERGELGTFRSLAQLVPSSRQQREVDAAVRSDAELWPRLEASLRKSEFRPEAFEPFRQALAEAPPEPLRLADLASTPLEPLVRPFRLALGEGVGIATFLADLHDETAVRDALAKVPGARLINIERTLSDAYGAYRERLLYLSAIGFLAVLLLVAARHRAVAPTLIAYVPAALAAAGTMGLLALCGHHFDLLSLVALLMVVSMGVDYGVFLAESGNERRHLDATRLAVFVAGISTILGFALLAWSDQPALFGIGLVAGTGIALCLALAPILATLLASKSHS
ncbi:MAG: MMPL family transporter [Planctomycetota bacterium]